MARLSLISLVVFVSGAVVLSLEILGTRILGPFYGVSLFLWSALITVTLAALSTGYFFGGRLADRRPVFVIPGYLLGCAGVWLILIPILKYPVLSLLEPMGLRAAVLLSAAILFGPPLVLLGMITPFAVRLSTTQVEHVGSTAGRLYAISTVASVIAGLLTGFFLIPQVGVTRLLFLLAALLLLTALIWNWYLRKRSNTLSVVLFVGIGTSVFGFTRNTHQQTGILFAKESSYGEIRVLDSEDGRYLLIDGTVHSLIDTTYWTSELEYIDVMEIPRSCIKQPGTVLLIGLGAGSLAKRYSVFGWNVDAVEIDPAIVDIARRYFHLKEDEAAITVSDGRRFLSSSDKTYDIILIDAFGSGAVPFHLVTLEAFELLKKHLNPGGILALNVWAVGWHDTIVRSIAATLEKSFNVVRAFPIVEPPNLLGNVIIMARDTAISLVYELPRLYSDPFYRFGPMYHRVHAWDNQFVPDTRDVPVLTDDLNPVDLWSESINYEARKDLLRSFEEKGISW